MVVAKSGNLNANYAKLAKEREFLFGSRKFAPIRGIRVKPRHKI
jgi:hypothetical protein